MSTRAPRLPMLLGLAFLTVAAHFLAAMAHLAGHVLLGRGGILLPALLTVAPLVGLWLIVDGRPRHGATLVALTMGAAAFHTLYAHYALDTDRADATWYAWTTQLLLAFELQGAILGMALAFRPQMPRPRGAQGKES